MIKIVNNEDGTKFVWRIVTAKEAAEIFNYTSIQIFALNQDGSESIIETRGDLNKAIDNVIDIAIEVGEIKTTTIG